jgi:hypothetical protein
MIPSGDPKWPFLPTKGSGQVNRERCLDEQVQEVEADAATISM